MKNEPTKPWNETPKCETLHLAYKTCHVCDLQKRVQKLEATAKKLQKGKNERS